MARSAYRQAVQLSSPGNPVVGVGATCALRTNREKKGDHKVFVASLCGRTLRTYAITLAKGARSRAEEDALASLIVVQALATASEHACRLPGDALTEGEHIEVPKSCAMLFWEISPRFPYSSTPFFNHMRQTLCFTGGGNSDGHPAARAAQWACGLCGVFGWPCVRGRPPRQHGLPSRQLQPLSPGPSVGHPPLLLC